MELIKSTNINLQGKNAVVIGRSKLVGSPMANLLKLNDCTVTICHSKTNNLSDFCKTADILVVAIGKANFVKQNWIKPGAIVIDCGINSVLIDNKSKIIGDIDYEGVSKVAGHVTPVPGGVGPMTISMLLANTVESAVRFYNKFSTDSDWIMQFNPLKLKSPVPEDIEIAKAQQPKKISTIAQEIHLLESEYECYGHSKAKVSLSVLNRTKNKPNGNYVVVTG
jgi:methylenetetrahydrofolate dehydrogenase (NADP+) / methenyltetrahydrofolate cyclohydrolase / formyltetrahydrofolate synthetase